MSKEGLPEGFYCPQEILIKKGSTGIAESAIIRGSFSVVAGRVDWGPSMKSPSFYEQFFEQVTKGKLISEQIPRADGTKGRDTLTVQRAEGRLVTIYYYNA